MISTIFSNVQLEAIANALEDISGDKRYPYEDFTQRIASALRTLSKKNGGPDDKALDSMDFANQIVAAIKTTDERWEDIGGGGGGEYPAYEGPYEITPKVVQQVLTTIDTHMRKNVTVHSIPYQEVTNKAGGLTATIASN